MKAKYFYEYREYLYSDTSRYELLRFIKESEMFDEGTQEINLIKSKPINLLKKCEKIFVNNLIECLEEDIENYAYFDFEFENGEIEELNKELINVLRRFFKKNNYYKKLETYDKKDYEKIVVDL